MVEKDSGIIDTFDFKQIRRSLKKVEFSNNKLSINNQTTKKIEKINLNKEDYICSLCLCMYLKPVTTLCKHTFCEYCFEQYVENNILGNIKCPFCKTEIVFDKKLLKHQISYNKEIDNILKINYSEEYKSRESKLLKEISLMPKHIKIRIAYGNTYFDIEKPKISRNSQHTVKHGYVLFVEQVSTSDNCNVISSVDYKLHPTYAVTDYKIKSEPFILKRAAWGYFTVPIKINLKRGFLNMKNKEKFIDLEHELCFNEGGKRNELILFIIKS